LAKNAEGESGRFKNFSIVLIKKEREFMLMQFIRKVIESKELEGILDILEELKGKKIELIILPINDEMVRSSEYDTENWFDSFSPSPINENESNLDFAFKPQSDVVLRDES
jgi:hypothetical protein